MRWKRILRLTVLVILMVLVILIGGRIIGGYFIQGFEQEDNLFGEHERTEQKEPEKRMILRLEPMTYYTLQLGTFSDVDATQEIINQLAQLGYRPFIKTGPPYKIWLGCFSEEDGELINNDQLKGIGQNLFISKNMVNEVALKFPENNQLVSQYIAPLLGKYSIVIDHSLKMFISSKYDSYPDEIWQAMIGQIQEEVNQCIVDTEKIVAMEDSENYRNELSKLMEVSQGYSSSLTKMIEWKKDDGVLSAQSYLLELIDGYHEYIISTNELLGEPIYEDTSR